MVDAERVVKARVSGARVDEVSEPELTDAAQPLEGGGVDNVERGRLDPDVLPDRIAYDGHVSDAGAGAIG